MLVADLTVNIGWYITFLEQQLSTAATVKANWACIWVHILSGAARQKLFSVTVSRSIYLSIYLCLSADFRRCKRLQRLGDRLPPSVARTARLRVYVTYFPAHCAGVTDMSPRYNLSPRCEDNRRHRRTRSSSDSQKDSNYIF